MRTYLYEASDHDHDNCRNPAFGFTQNVQKQDNVWSIPFAPPAPALSANIDGKRIDCKRRKGQFLQNYRKGYALPRAIQAA
jgi:hypothetical protein